MNNIANEIQIHDGTETSTCIGPQAIRLKLNGTFQIPTTVGFHLYDSKAELIWTLSSYPDALDTARQHNHILVWRQDLNPVQLYPPKNPSRPKHMNSTPAPAPQYVIGFLLNEEPVTGIALVQPTESNLLDGITGLVENDETPKQRILRASLQHFGVTPPAWKQFAILNETKNGEFRIVHCFYARSNETLRNIQQVTNHQIVKLYVSDLMSQQTAPNVQWLIPMALSASLDPSTSYFIGQETLTTQTPGNTIS